MTIQTTITTNTYLNDKLLKVSDDVNEVRHIIGLLSDLSCIGKPGDIVQINTDYLATTFGRLEDMLIGIEDYIRNTGELDNIKCAVSARTN